LTKETDGIKPRRGVENKFSEYCRYGEVIFALVSKMEAPSSNPVLGNVPMTYLCSTRSCGIILKKHWNKKQTFFVSQNFTEQNYAKVINGRPFFQLLFFSPGQLLPNANEIIFLQLFYRHGLEAGLPDGLFSNQESQFG
jgi:hypothetical protein